MKAVIVDNNSKHIPALTAAAAAAGFVPVVFTWSTIDKAAALESEALILSGGSGLAVTSHLDDLAVEFSVVRERAKPTLGICLGAEIIAHVFGAWLKYRPERERGEAAVRVITPDELFGNLKEFRAHEAHKFYLDALPTPLIALAESLSGIEVFRHCVQPLYGVQFHPEANPELGGASILKNFFALSERLSCANPDSLISNSSLREAGAR